MSREEVLNRVNKTYARVESRVKAGIDQNRRGDARLVIVGEDLKPLKGVKVEVRQKNHEFRHGANIFMLDQFETEEKNQKYKELFKGAFNMATLPFYWCDTEPEKGKTRYGENSPDIYRRPPIDLCLRFCRENGIEPREHALAYDHFFPDWLKNATAAEVRDEYEKHCAELAQKYANVIKTIEVTNEHGWFEGKTAFYEDDNFVEDCFKIAEKYFGGNELVINEWAGLWDKGVRNRVEYYMIIERALSKGARIDAVGMQYHMFFRAEAEAQSTVNYYNMEHVLGIMDLYSRFNLPLQITEVTIPAYTEAQRDEEIQAEILTRLYNVWFSHPNVEQIIYWNLVDGYAAFAPQGDMTAGENYFRGGLIGFDFTPKKAYNAIVDLFKKEWNTRTECVSDEHGKAGFRGFYGDYELKITADGKCVTKDISLRKGTKNEFTLVM